MTSPLSQWRCDVCSKLIEDSNKGYVTWDNNQGAQNFKIIHQGECDDRRQHHSAALTQFLGMNGLAYLTSLMTYGPLIDQESSVPRIGNLDQFADFFRRVQLAHYEEARTHFQDQQVREDYQDSNEYRPYMQDVLSELAALK